MWIQKSYGTEKQGILYIVPTPIGNLQDMTFRAVDVLKDADVIAAEDTRHTKRLCHYFSIDTPLVSYHEHNKRERETNLVERAKKGETIALVSDAGTPAISDPGADLVARFAEEELPVIALPGANAALTALVTSGLSTEAFSFIGFLSRRKKERDSMLHTWKASRSTLVFYEAPHRLKDTLSAIHYVLGNRRVSLSRELTKQYETIVRGDLEEILPFVESEGVRGEYVIVVEGASPEEAESIMQQQEAWWENLSVVEHVQAYMLKQQLDSKEAIKQTAKDRGLKKRDVYQSYHISDENER